MVLRPDGFIQVTPHVYKLDLPLFGGVMRVGVWLVRDAEGWTMVDAGAPRDALEILQATLAMTNGQAPTRIVLTHGHYDHAGSLRALQDRWQIPALVHSAEAPFVTGAATYGSVRPAWWGYRVIHRAVGRRSSAPSARHIGTVSDGEWIAGMKVVHLPGHTPGMIGLVHREDRAALAGDAFISRGGRLRPPYAVFTADLEEARRSMARLAAEDFDHLLASHGRPIHQRGKLEAARAVDRSSLNRGVLR